VLFPLKLKLFGPVHDIVAHTADHEISVDVELQVRGLGLFTIMVGAALSDVIVTVFPAALHPFVQVDTIVYIPGEFIVMPVVHTKVAITIEPLLITALAVGDHAFPVSIIDPVAQDKVVPLLVRVGVGGVVSCATV
jgi:hypothetical protein